MSDPESLHLMVINTVWEYKGCINVSKYKLLFLILQLEYLKLYLKMLHIIAVFDITLPHFSAALCAHKHMCGYLAEEHWFLCVCTCLFVVGS